MESNKYTGDDMDYFHSKFFEVAKIPIELTRVEALSALSKRYLWLVSYQVLGDNKAFSYTFK